MRRIVLLLCASAACLSLAGCGNKGVLYLPPPPTPLKAGPKLAPVSPSSASAPAEAATTAPASSSSVQTAPLSH